MEECWLASAKEVAAPPLQGLITLLNAQQQEMNLGNIFARENWWLFLMVIFHLPILTAMFYKILVLVIVSPTIFHIHFQRFLQQNGQNIRNFFFFGN